MCSALREKHDRNYDELSISLEAKHWLTLETQQSMWTLDLGFNKSLENARVHVPFPGLLMKQYLQGLGPQVGKH